MSKNVEAARPAARVDAPVDAPMDSPMDALADARGHAIRDAPAHAPGHALTKALVAAAQAVRARAHAPYSKFAVGAAVLDEQGRIHAGCNVENAAYPQGWCAEASALAVMVAAGGKRVQALVVCGVAEQPVTPCGGCRQKLREFAADDCPVWAADMTGPRASFTLGALLPSSFGPEYLQRP